MLDEIFWYLKTQTSDTGWTPMLRVALICVLLYQADLVIVFGNWLLRKIGLIETNPKLEPRNCKSVMVVLPTLLRTEAELEALITAACSAAENDYPGPLTIVTCIDGYSDRTDLYERLRNWARNRTSNAVRFLVTGTERRASKAVAIHVGIEYVQRLVSNGQLPMIPEVFFNMDADSVLGPRALERMVYQLTRKRRLVGTPHTIVTSNVVVPIEQYIHGLASIKDSKAWLALMVAREYLSSITCSRFNWKLIPLIEVSGALYCTWTDIHIAAAYYARFMQSLTLKDYVRWWLGFGPPRFSHYRGEPLPEAMGGPGDDTWIAWLAMTANWRNGRLNFDAPSTPLHALGRFLIGYFSRSIAYDPLAKVFTHTPTTVKALFNQRLRWNSSRIQDSFRWFPSYIYHWQLGVPLLAETIILVVCIAGITAGIGIMAYGVFIPPGTLPVAVMIAVGYLLTRVTSTVVALLVSDSPLRDWIKVVALPFAGFFHIVFNTTTMMLGYFRDIFGFGEPTTFAPEETLRKGRLSRLAIAYRFRRAVMLAMRSVTHGDVPLGRFWFGWRDTPWTPSGFDGWTSGKRSSALRLPQKESNRSDRTLPPSSEG